MYISDIKQIKYINTVINIHISEIISFMSIIDITNIIPQDIVSIINKAIAKGCLFVNFTFIFFIS